MGLNTLSVHRFCQISSNKEEKVTKSLPSLKKSNTFFTRLTLSCPIVDLGEDDEKVNISDRRSVITDNGEV